MKVTGWTDWKFPEEKTKYETVPDDFYDVARQAVIKEIQKHNYSFCGDTHQNYDYGVPIIDDKWVLQCSQREWGGIMAEAHNDINQWAYLRWYITTPESPKAKYPIPEDYK